jgi:hypothetical protein
MEALRKELEKVTTKAVESEAKYQAEVTKTQEVKHENKKLKK